jgi:hypothetical protein
MLYLKNQPGWGVAARDIRHSLRQNALCNRRFVKTALRVLFFFVLQMCSVVRIEATVVKKLELADLVQQAEIIADVTVVGVESYWASPSGERAIHTRVSFSLNAPPLKGHVNSPFVLDFLGGTVANVRTEVSGMPKFALGDRLILFSYAPDKAFASPLIGFNQGAMRVVRDERDNVDRVYHLSGQPMNVAEPSNSKSGTSDSALTAEKLHSADRLDEFLQHVTKLLIQ